MNNTFGIKKLNEELLLRLKYQNFQIRQKQRNIFSFIFLRRIVCVTIFVYKAMPSAVERFRA
jgi:hypothetical protein